MCDPNHLQRSTVGFCAVPSECVQRVQRQPFVAEALANRPADDLQNQRLIEKLFYKMQRHLIADTVENFVEGMFGPGYFYPNRFIPRLN